MTNDLFLFDLEETVTQPDQATVKLLSATHRASEMVRRWASATNTDLPAKLPVGSRVVLGNCSGVAEVVAVIGPFDDKGRNYWNVLMKREDGKEKYTVVTGVRETDAGFSTVSKYNCFILENDAPQRGDDIGEITLPMYSTVGNSLKLGQAVGVTHGAPVTIVGRRGNWLLVDDEGEEKVLTASFIRVFRSYSWEINAVTEKLEQDVFALPTIQSLQAKRMMDLRGKLSAILAKEMIDEIEFKSFYALIQRFGDEGDEALEMIEQRLGFIFESEGKRFEVKPEWSNEYLNGLMVSSTEEDYGYGLRYQPDLSVIGKREALAVSLHVPRSHVKGEAKKKGRKADKMLRKHLRERVELDCDAASSLPEVACNSDLMIEIAAIKAMAGLSETAEDDLTRAEMRLSEIQEEIGRKNLLCIAETILAPGFTATESEIASLAQSLRCANELVGYDHTASSLLDLLSGRVIACEVGDGHWAAIWDGNFHGAVSSSGFRSGVTGDNSMASLYADTVNEVLKNKRSREEQLCLPPIFRGSLEHDLSIIDDINDRSNLRSAAERLSKEEAHLDAIKRACIWLESSGRNAFEGFGIWLQFAKVQHYLCYSFEPDVAVMEAIALELSVHFTKVAGVHVAIGSRHWEINGEKIHVDANRFETIEKAEAVAKLLAECKRDGVEEDEILQRISVVLPANPQSQEVNLLGMEDGEDSEHDDDGEEESDCMDDDEGEAEWDGEE